MCQPDKQTRAEESRRIGGNIAPADCPEGECPGWEGMKSAYGFCGGGGDIGVYNYCPKCYRTFDFSADPEMCE